MDSKSPVDNITSEMHIKIFLQIYAKTAVEQRSLKGFYSYMIIYDIVY